MGAGILQDLVVVISLAAAVTILFYKLRQPVVLGYLLAGLVVGPHALRLVTEGSSIEGLADLGIIFLMFAVGLEFDLHKLRKVGVAACVAAALEVTIMLGIGYAVGQWLGWGPMPSIFLGAVVSISSTSIIVKVLTEMGKLKEEYSELAFGILIIEDILAVVIVALLSSAGRTGSFDPALIWGTVGAVLLFVFIFVAVGLVLVPRLIDAVSKFHVEEVLVITVVGLAFSAALLALNVGFSLALGAFLIGAIIAESKAVQRVEHKIVPLRDLFTAVFFVAVGMLIDVRVLTAHWQTILIVAAATVLGKVFAVTVSTFVAGYDGRTAFKTGTALGQIGEFSFIIAGLGLSLHVVNNELPSIAIAVCAITSLLSGLLIGSGPRLADTLAPHMPRWWVGTLDAYTRAVNKIGAKNGDDLAHHDRRQSRHGARVLIYAAWLFGLLIFAAYVSSWLGAEAGRALSLGSNATRAAAVGFLGLAGLPLFVAFTKATENYAFSAAKAREMAPGHLTAREATYRTPKFVARSIAAVASVVLVGLAIRVAWGVHPLAIPSTWLLVPVLAILGLVGAVFWTKLERLYHGMEKTLNSLMGVDDEPAHDEANRKLQEALPFGLDADEVTVKNFTRAAYVSLKGLALRDKTGATVLAVERNGGVIHNPHADVLLLPNDLVVLVGSPDQLARARRYMDEGLPEMRSIRVVEEDVRLPASSPAVGRSVAELDLGARIGAVVKRDGSMMAPHERVKLEPDDRIVMYGPEASIDAARERLKVKAWPQPRPKKGPAGR